MRMCLERRLRILIFSVKRISFVYDKENVFGGFLASGGGFGWCV